MDWYWLAASLFGLLMLFLALGIPVALALGLAATSVIYIFLGPHMFIRMARVAFEVSTNHLFIVAPLFILIAGIVSHSNIAERSFHAATKWLNWMPASLPVSTVAAATAFSAISGSSPATAAAVGYAAVPEMLRHGYNKRLAVGVVAAGGTLGVLIPPSVVMIIYGIVTETSIGALFMAGIIPGIMLSFMMMTYAILRCWSDPDAPQLDSAVTWSERVSSLQGVWPIFLLFGVVIGTIYSGIATPVEAAALGAVAVIILTFRLPNIGIRGLNTVLVRTAQTTSMVILLIIFGSFFGFAVSALGIAHGMIQAIVAADIEPWMVLACYIVVLLLLGCVIDPISLLIITLPLAFPVLYQLGFDPIWLGVLVTIAVEIGMITPPVGMNLFILKGVVPKEITTRDITLGALPFVLVLLGGLMILVAFPPLATWLPSMMAR